MLSDVGRNSFNGNLRANVDKALLNDFPKLPQKRLSLANFGVDVLDVITNIGPDDSFFF